MRRRPRIVGVENRLRGLLGQPQLVPVITPPGLVHARALGSPALTVKQRKALVWGITIAAGGTGQEIGGRVGEQIASAAGLGDSLVSIITGGIGRAAAVLAAWWLYRSLRRLLRI
jgi:hypothetical protein